LYIEVIENYIRNQLQEDIVADQNSMEERKNSNPLGLLE